MSIFNKQSEGGLMDVIRCDQDDYLIWKWRPSGATQSTKKENSIRYGSSLRVKDGEVAVFLYQQKDGTMQDFIVGPFDQTIKTANFPILTSIVGLAYGGSSPFQAEVYYINLARVIQTRFGVPYFDVFDPRFLDFPVQMAVRGTITFQITDYQNFIKLHRLIEFDISKFERQIRDAVIKYIKAVVSNIPTDYGIPAIQIERRILQVNEMVSAFLTPRLEADFGVKLGAIDVSALEVDKSTPSYAELRRITADQVTNTIIGQGEINLRNLNDAQRINSQNTEETLRVQREEMQRAQRLQSESLHLATHQLNQQARVANTAAESLGKMGAGGAGSMGGGNGGMMDPGAMMASMAMGGAVGSGMAGAVNNMMQGMNQQQQTPPPPPTAQYFHAVNGQQTGPYNWQQLQQMVGNGQITCDSHVWKAGMVNWEIASNVQELSTLFNMTPPPPPPTT